MLPSGTVTFLFTDIEGSTARWESDSTGMKQALAGHNETLDRVFAEFGGHVFKTLGDAYCVAFRSAEDAAKAALAGQEALKRDPSNLKVRMGLHTAGIEPTGNDYFGPPLNRVARIMAAASGGQILVSEASKALLPSGLPLRDLGVHALRDLLEPAHLWQLGAGDFAAIRGLAAIRNNLPVQTTSFLGREEEMAEMDRLLEKARLLTLTGMGGTGKSRLSLQFAANNLDRYPDGVWFCEFAALSEREDMLRLIVTAVAAPESGGDLSGRLTAYLSPKKSLLILDNCEHILDAASKIAEDLLLSCPSLTLLATSREPLGARGEAVFRVPSLGVPDAAKLPTLDDLERFGSTALFLDRLSTAAPSYHLESSEAPIIAKICGRLDGIPLAIELAAARGRAMSLGQIEQRLDDRFRLLTGGSRNALSRQQTLKALIDWSVNLLSEKERAFFVSLAVFSGGWTLEAAEKVCSGYEGAEVEEYEVLDLLAALVDKSLVVFEKATDRYRMLESLRQYALDRLEQQPELLALRDHHAEFFLKLSDRLSYESPYAEQDYKTFEADFENYRSAVEWASGQEHLEVQAVTSMSDGFWAFYSMSIPQEFLRLMEPLYARVSPRLDEAQRMKARLTITVGYVSSDQSRGYELALEMKEGLERIEPPQLRSHWRVTIGYAILNHGRAEEGAKFSEEAIRIDDGSWPQALAHFYRQKGLARTLLREYDVALKALEEAQRQYVEGNRRREWVSNHVNLITIYCFQEKYDQAVESALRLNFDSMREKLFPFMRAATLIAFGHAAVNRGEVALASKLAGGAAKMRRSTGFKIDPVDLLAETTLIDRIKNEPGFGEAFEAGRAFDWEPWLGCLLDVRFEDLPRPIEVPFREMILGS